MSWHIFPKSFGISRFGCALRWLQCPVGQPHWRHLKALEFDMTPLSLTWWFNMTSWYAPKYLKILYHDTMRTQNFRDFRCKLFRDSRFWYSEVLQNFPRTQLPLKAWLPPSNGLSFSSLRTDIPLEGSASSRRLGLESLVLLRSWVLGSRVLLGIR